MTESIAVLAEASTVDASEIEGVGIDGFDSVADCTSVEVIWTVGSLVTSGDSVVDNSEGAGAISLDVGDPSWTTSARSVEPGVSSRDDDARVATAHRSKQ